MSFPENPDIRQFSRLRDRDLVREGIMIAEGPLVVERLLASRAEMLGLVCLPRDEAEWRTRAAGRCPVSALPEEELAGLVGFAFHRGVLAAARAPAVPGLEDWWRDLRGAAGSPAGLPTRVVLCPALTDAENLGSIYRCASALGWDAVGMGPECITPYSRRGLRVSMANCLSLPGFRLAADNDFSPLKRLGFVVVGASLHAEARHLAELRQTLAELASVNPPEDPIRLALVFGNEYHGLRPDQEAACDHLVTIPMHRGTDSLNVAVAAGILMFELGKCQD